MPKADSVHSTPRPSAPSNSEASIETLSRLHTEAADQIDSSERSEPAGASKLTRRACCTASRPIRGLMPAPAKPAGSRRRFFLFRRVRGNDSNRGALARQGRLTWLRNFIPPRSTSILKIPRNRPKPTARWVENLCPLLLAHFLRLTPFTPPR